MVWLLSLVFFFSGASALIFEGLWFHLLGITLGNSVWSTAIVLASFMGGLALGNAIAVFYSHKIRFPARTYAFLELTVAVAGFLLVVIFSKLIGLLAPLFSMIFEQTALLNFLRLLISFLLLLIPTTAMGATLPVLVKALNTATDNFGSSLGILYGWNTLGAVAGILLNEIFLVKHLGIMGAGVAAASLNIFIAIVVLSIFVKNASDVSSGATTASLRKLSLASAHILLASFLAGFTMLGLEVVWFRFMMLFFGAYSLTFAIMLATVLAGISLGGLVTGKIFQLRKNLDDYLVPISVANGCWIILSYNSFDLFLWLFENNSVKLVVCSSILMFPVSFISGCIFTILGNILYQEIQQETRAAGFLTLANTIGALLGSLAAGLLLLPYLGIEKTFFFFALTYGGMAFLFIAVKKTVFDKRKAAYYALMAIFVITAALFPFGLMQQVFINIPLKAYQNFNVVRVAYREGLTGTIQYLQENFGQYPLSYRLITNSYSMSATNLRGKRYMKLFAYLPLALHPNPKNALLVCFGCGTTAKALTDAPWLERLEVVDISRDILELSSVVFPNAVDNPMHDPRVKIYIEDGRFFLQTTQHKFDLITAEPPPPALEGIANLYSQEYFQLIYNRLAEGGMVSYWLPVSQLEASQTKAIIKAFTNVFANSSLWTGGGFEWILLGIKNPIRPVAADQFSRLWQHPTIALEMQALGLESPEQLGSLFIADGTRLRELAGDIQPLLDNYPKRLSYTPENIPITYYQAWLDVALSRHNFYNSSMIARVWPDSLKTKTAEHFAVRNTINNLLAVPEDFKYSFIEHLHICAHTPLLTNYILWVFESNQYIQSIIKDATKKHLSLGAIQDWHLAADAVRQKNYRAAADHIYSSMKHGRDFKQIEMHYALRVYLLFLVGDETAAEEVSQEYIHFYKTGTRQREIRVANFWAWLQENVKKNR
jgi:predicted membrane-bound spermidine synthase